ncbi:hypothetical protein KVT40_000050 [Elsinoe batatas]|uniref:Scytalone dehydratase-like domain-containing protein n=1 Tax=Elsinoe batatas TaxID=2601811 RepID=A0A8K0LB94_9PEZI|nr:hypothetical protein KVT40_000050 [Elsinoe batatas]
MITPYVCLALLGMVSASSTPAAGQYAAARPGNDTAQHALDYSIQDERKFGELSFKWTQAWDLKDRNTFLAITGPQVVANYSDYPAVGTSTVATPEAIFDRSFMVTALGDPRLQTQHLLGSAIFTRTNQTEAKGQWQTRARHVRVLGNGTEAQWESSVYTEFTYSIVGGEWKLTGLRPYNVVATTGRPEDVIGQF